MRLATAASDQNKEVARTETGMWSKCTVQLQQSGPSKVLAEPMAGEVWPEYRVKFGGGISATYVVSYPKHKDRITSSVDEGTANRLLVAQLHCVF